MGRGTFLLYLNNLKIIFYAGIPAGQREKKRPPTNLSSVGGRESIPHGT